MSFFERFRRLAGGSLPLLACAALTACSGGSGGGTGPDGEAAALQVASRNPHPGIAGQILPDSLVVRVVDAQGRGVANVWVEFSITSGGGRLEGSRKRSDAEGYARAMWLLGAAGPFTVTARADGVPSVQLQARTVDVAPAAAPMFADLSATLEWSVARLGENIMGNPDAEPFIRERLSVLRTPGLGGDILDQGRYAQGGYLSRSGATVPVTAIFPAEAMRADAMTSIDRVEATLPVMEELLKLPFPTADVRLWNGFMIKDYDRGPRPLILEDRATYAARTQGAAPPYDSLLVHGLAHAWAGHESITRFLAMYGYNVPRTGSEDVAQWTGLDGYFPDFPGNTGSHALLDVYRLVGRDAMGDGLRAVIALRPGYAQPLSPAMQQAFVDAMPDALKPAVAAKLERVGT